MSEPAKVLSRVGEKLGALLTEEMPRGRGAAARAATPGPLERDVFERHVEGVLSQRGQALTGGVNLIGLDRVKEALGARWEKLAGRADEIARRAIERRLDPTDVYTRHGDLQYVVVFSHLSNEQAQLKCSLIAEDIARRLLGEDVAPGLFEVKTMVSPAAPDAPGGVAPSVAALAARLAGGETSAVEPAEPKGEAGDDWWEALHTDPFDAVVLVYRPLWDVRRNVLATFVCTPAVRGVAGRLITSEAEIPGIGGPAMTARLDTLMQRRVIGDLRNLMARGEKRLLCLPVHFETLAASASRVPYLERCRRGIPAGGERLLAFELVGVPAGAPQGRLLDLASGLRRTSRAVMRRVARNHSFFNHPSETGVAAMGFNHGAAGDEPQQIREMESFATAARKAGVASYVRGLPSISLVTAAIGAGIDFVDGDVVHSVVEHPSQPCQFDINDLYSRVIPGSCQGETT